jgi:hypothetical protein
VHLLHQHTSCSQSETNTTGYVDLGLNDSNYKRHEVHVCSNTLCRGNPGWTRLGVGCLPTTQLTASHGIWQHSGSLLLSGESL